MTTDNKTKTNNDAAQIAAIIAAATGLLMLVADCGDSTALAVITKIAAIPPLAVAYWLLKR